MNNSNLTVPSHVDLLNPTLRALHRRGGSSSVGEIYDEVISDLKPLPEVVRIPHGKGNQTEIEYRLAWARTYLKIFGLVENSERGVWSLTAKGNETVTVNTDEVVRYVQTQSRKKRTSQKTDTSQNALIEVVADSTDESATWREALLEVLLDMSPESFERLCQRLLRESGFIEVEVTGRSGDGGIDGHGIIRVAGLISFPVLFQCKRYKDNVGASTVRDFRGAMIGRADKGLIITTGGFTREAQAEATRDGAPPIDLINGELLINKLKELSLGVTTKMVEAVEVDTKWFESM